MKKIIMYLIGMNLIALAVVLNIRWNLGVAAFSSLMYSISKIYSLSLGTASILVYLIIVLIQFILLKKMTYELLLEIPVSFLFGFLTDFYDYLIIDFQLSFILRIILFILTMFITALGVYLSVKSNLALTPVDGIVKTISEVFHLKFSLVKNSFDLTMVLLTCVVCLFNHTSFYGIGIGTILTVIFIGRIISLYEKYINY